MKVDHQTIIAGGSQQTDQTDQIHQATINRLCGRLSNSFSRSANNNKVSHCCRILKLKKLPTSNIVREKNTAVKTAAINEGLHGLLSGHKLVDKNN